MRCKIIPTLAKTLLHNSSLLLLALLFIGVSCKKNKPPEEDELPPLTHEGKNTFGCKINGGNWVASTPGSIGGPSPLQGEWLASEGTLDIYATRKNNENEVYDVINLFAKNLFDQGTFQITTEYSNGQPWLGFHCHENNFTCGAYYHDSLNPGTITITYFNATDFIISGTFEMTLKNPNCTDSIMVITDGRFDLKY